MNIKERPQAKWLSLINERIDIPLHVNPPWGVGPQFINPVSLQAGDTPKGRTAPPGSNVFVDDEKLCTLRVSVMEFPIVARHSMFGTTCFNKVNVFRYSCSERSDGPPYILLTTWASQKIDYPCSSASAELFYLVETAGHGRGETLAGPPTTGVKLADQTFFTGVETNQIMKEGRFNWGVDDIRCQLILERRSAFENHLGGLGQQRAQNLVSFEDIPMVFKNSFNVFMLNRKGRQKGPFKVLIYLLRFIL